MDKSLKSLKMISKFTDSSWKIGKSDDYIKSVLAKMNYLPKEAFNTFFIDDSNTRKISTIDFAVLTADMPADERNALMDLYGISNKLIDDILKVAEEIEQISISQIDPSTDFDKPIHNKVISPFDEK